MAVVVAVAVVVVAVVAVAVAVVAVAVPSYLVPLVDTAVLWPPSVQPPWVSGFLGS